MAEDESYTTLREFVTQLLEAGLDGRTIDRIIGYMARDRWRAACAAVITGSADISPTALGFAAQLDEHVDRVHGLCASMLGLREVLGDETSLKGTH